MNLLLTTPPSIPEVISENLTGVVFLIHGTRNVEAQSYIYEAMTRLCPLFAQTLELPLASVTYSFLEIMEPALEVVLKEMCAAGKTDLRVVPLLLFPGSHLNHDIPRIAREMMEQFPNVHINVGECIGVNDPEFLSILLKRL